MSFIDRFKKKSVNPKNQLEKEVSTKEAKPKFDFKKFMQKEFRNLESFEMNDETMKNSGSWPLLVKIISVILLNITIVFLANQFHFKKVQNEYNKSMKQEKVLMDSVIFKIKQTAGVEEYKTRIDNMKLSFEEQLSQLPTAVEIDGLLKDITETAMSNGIEVEKFQMLKEVSSEFYIEVPIEIKLIGTYHSLGNFIGEVSHLERIVTFHDFNLTQENEEGLLSLRVIAKTYKYKETSKEGESQ